MVKKQPDDVGKRADKSKAYIKRHRDPIRSVEDLVGLIQHNRWSVDLGVWNQALEDELRADPKFVSTLLCQDGEWRNCLEGWSSGGSR